jgi:hypothetical protein
MLEALAKYLDYQILEEFLEENHKLLEFPDFGLKDGFP